VGVTRGGDNRAVHETERRCRRKRWGDADRSSAGIGDGLSRSGKTQKGGLMTRPESASHDLVLLYLGLFSICHVTQFKSGASLHHLAKSSS